MAPTFTCFLTVRLPVELLTRPSKGLPEVRFLGGVIGGNKSLFAKTCQMLLAAAFNLD